MCLNTIFGLIWVYIRQALRSRSGNSAAHMRRLNDSRTHWDSYRYLGRYTVISCPTGTLWSCRWQYAPRAAIRPPYQASLPAQHDVGFCRFPLGKLAHRFAPIDWTGDDIKQTLLLFHENSNDLLYGDKPGTLLWFLVIDTQLLLWIRKMKRVYGLSKFLLS